MVPVEKEDLDELRNLVKRVMQNIAALPDSDRKPEQIKDSRQALQTFHTTAAMLGLNEAERVGVELESYLMNTLEPAQSIDVGFISSFTFALDVLLEEMGNLSNGRKKPPFDSDRVIATLHPTSLVSDTAEEGALTSDEFPLDFQQSLEGETTGLKKVNHTSLPLDFSRLDRMTNNLGGVLTVDNDGGAGSFQIKFPLSANNLEKIEALLSSCNFDSKFAAELSEQDSRLKKVLDTIKEFMVAFSTGDIIHSQDILLKLAEQQHQAGLYKEIGVLARELHNSLRGFMDTMDPALKDLVEDKIPDSGSRLEHILQLTENAANTTLDHVEAMQLRNQDEQKSLSKIQDILGGLRAIGDTARGRLTELQGLLEGLQSSTVQTSNDLITVLTAQDYQDLTGQIILKIIQLLKDLELKLVGVIKTFGVRLDGQKQKHAPNAEELYGPAHKGKAEALHSQDDVDSLLAEFGF